MTKHNHPRRLPLAIKARLFVYRVALPAAVIVLPPLAVGCILAAFI